MRRATKAASCFLSLDSVNANRYSAMPLDRRLFLQYCSALGLTGTLFPGVLYAKIEEGEPITPETIACAERIAGLSFTEEQRQMMVEDLTERLKDYEALRQVPLPNDVIPAFVFDPTIGGEPIPEGTAGMRWEPRPVERPRSDEDLAFMTVAELSYLLKTRQVRSVELTELYLARLKRYDPVLKAVITYTEERAMAQAQQADEELDAGHWRGPLHGVPYGAKDLLAVPGYRTTWGAKPYENQVLDVTAAVIEKLDAAGAVLVAKLTLGALAWGDVWFGGQTKKPLEHRAGIEWLFGGTRGGGGGRAGAVRDRLGDAGLDRVALDAERRDRPSSDVRGGEPLRGHDAGLDDGQARPHGPFGRGLRARVRCDPGARPARSEHTRYAVPVRSEFRRAAAPRGLSR